MSILESYKDLFLNPRHFAKDKLKHGLEWWKYALIVLGLNILIGYMQNLSGAAQQGEGVVMQIFAFAVAFLGIFIINQPFRKKMKVREYYKVNLAFNTYSAFVFVIINALTIATAFMSPILSLIPVLLSFIAIVWLVVCYCKAISELHKVSAWAIFGMTVVFGFVMMIIMSFFLFGWIMMDAFA